MKTDENHLQESRRQRWQFSLRGLLVVTTAVATLLAIATHKPWWAIALGVWVFVILTLDLAVTVRSAATRADRGSAKGARAVPLVVLVLRMLVGAILVALGVVMIFAALTAEGVSMGAAIVCSTATIVGGVIVILAAWRRARQSSDATGRSNATRCRSIDLK